MSDDLKYIPAHLRAEAEKHIMLYGNCYLSADKKTLVHPLDVEFIDFDDHRSADLESPEWRGCRSQWNEPR